MYGDTRPIRMKRPSLGRGAPLSGKPPQALIKGVKIAFVAVGDNLARLRGKIADNFRGIGVRRIGDENARHSF